VMNLPVKMKDLRQLLVQLIEETSQRSAPR
jgi:hypothetical protein